MQSQHKPVLIFAQSGRFLAQSATQAGYRVWVADCFGDQETLIAAERWQQLPPLSELSSHELLSLLLMVTQGEECMLICGSGIESLYSILNQLPSTIQLLGNSFDTVHAIKTPRLFFKLLARHKLSVPETVFETPENSVDWLVKSALGMGGNHIQHLNSAQSNINPLTYFQKMIFGSTGSALFLANGTHSQLISINKQNVSEDQHSPFQLGSIETPWLISAQHKKEIESAINDITLETGLLGLNSLDFIISEQGKLYLLEVNPRPSASAELTKNKAILFQHHINACQGSLPSPSIMQSIDNASLYYIYATHDLTIPHNMDWPIECHDRPVPLSLIHKGEPICTALVSVKNKESAKELHSYIEQKLFKQLSPLGT
ncbi:MAG: ATP-grasp domain-containing protein [Gammaproteobacteria bacterium]|nr:ATP-grasp domain-containing protein [Gammaproteobacteria bacterium]